jgi:uncharacterized SAM-binding protein YcdF (DUF218 family)
MPTAAPSRRPRPPRADRRGAGSALRAATWLLHVMVTAVAVLSVGTGRFDLWVDLRRLGPTAVLFEIVWAGATLLVPFCAGPRPAGLFARPRWVRRGFMPAWALYLLWPTYALLACLIGNTVYYYWLLRQGLTDPSVPLPLLAALLLGAWVLLTREWIRRADTGPAEAAAPRWGPVAAVAAAVPAVGVLAASFLVHIYARPPADAADLAVVLGGYVKSDGTASVLLSQRAVAAADLYRRGLVRHVLLSGGIFPPAARGLPERNEVAAMKAVCLAHGVPEDALSLDPVGINTRATAFNTREFMQTHGYRSVVACSTDFHLFRTALAFREVGVAAATVPAPPAAWRCADPRDTLREVVAVAVYALNPRYRQPKALAMQLASPRVRVSKSAGTVDLFDGGTLVKTYRCITGSAQGDKAVEGDRKTPEGAFHVVFKNPESKFHLSLGLDYPNKEDADRGLAAGLITPAQHADILAALASDLTRDENQKKLWYTPLGGEIFLHGHGDGRTGTAGCVALANGDIEELYALLPLGTPVVIEP